MKNVNKVCLGTIVSVLLLSLNAWALPYPVVRNDVVTMLSSDTNAEYEGHYQYKVASGTIYGTFCIELNEYFNPGSTYTVSNISTYAEKGGIGGASAGKDALSNATKWLFYHFLNKDILAVTGIAENDYSLQLAFWKLENELDSSSSFRTAYNNDSVAQHYYSDAIASGSAGAGYDVMVMNLVDSNGNYAQSQLVGAAPVPEPASIVLLGIGMLGLAIYGKRRVNRDV